MLAMLTTHALAMVAMYVHFTVLAMWGPQILWAVLTCVGNVGNVGNVCTLLAMPRAVKTTVNQKKSDHCPFELCVLFRIEVFISESRLCVSGCEM